MKNLITIIVLTALVVIPIQYKEYYDGGSFLTGLPLPWDSWVMQSGPDGDIWVEYKWYWAIPINIILTFIAASVIWLTFLFLINTIKKWSTEIRRQIQIEKTLRAKGRGKINNSKSQQGSVNPIHFY